MPMDEHRAYAGLLRAPQHRFAVIVIARAVEMRVGIDQQAGPPVGRGAVARVDPILIADH